MRILQELLTSTEGQFAIAVIGFMLAMGAGLNSRGTAEVALHPLNRAGGTDRRA